MMKIDIEYVLSLKTDDLRLIVSALAGRLKPEQKDKALELQGRLLKEKRNLLASMLQGVEKNIENIDK